ncbi:UMP kinase [Alphaproteobacteria bacterium 46_93_T64]|nr:UMP kinase [Alphaproteobacteria bacterium 46_93_T64]
MAKEPKYKRVLLKCSGEALLGNQQYGIDVETATRIAKDIRVAHDMGVEVCVVVGGGNIFRGVSGTAQGMDQANADYMGMMATVMNALALQHAIEKEGMDSRVLSAIPMASVCEPYIRRRAERHLERGRIVIFAAGTGNPFFTTDTAAALRAAEMKCDALLKGTNVDGVYDKDPAKHDDAIRFETLTHLDVISKDLKVMDAAAISLARENNIPILVFSIHEEGSISNVIEKKGRFTEVI